MGDDGKYHRVESTTSQVERHDDGSATLKELGDGAVRIGEAGATLRGQLTPDGVLQWCGEGVSYDWYRADRGKPVSLVRKDISNGVEEQSRVYVFSSSEWLETISAEASVEAAAAAKAASQQCWGFSAAASEAASTVPAPSATDAHAAAVVVEDRRIRKDLDKVWSGLRDCACGSFNESNTLLLDHSSDDHSHPCNVVSVPRFRSFRACHEMAKLEAFIARLLAEKPLKVVDFLKAHPREEWDAQ